MRVFNKYFVSDMLKTKIQPHFEKIVRARCLLTSLRNLESEESCEPADEVSWASVVDAKAESASLDREESPDMLRP